MRARMSGRTWRPNTKNSNNFQDTSDATMRVTLSRLKKRGYVENKKGTWQITKTGRAYLAKKISSFFPVHSKRINRQQPKSIIISFDIPEAHKNKRDWLRIELLCLGFEMLQRSVWLGPAPIPQEFVDSLRKLQILQYIKFFEAKEADII